MENGPPLQQSTPHPCSVRPERRTCWNSAPGTAATPCTAHGDDIYEYGGFTVHFSPPPATWSTPSPRGWNLEEVHAFEEGDLPRRLWRVTQTLPRWQRA
ncbi:hypothetical protein ADK49_12885 [Streptomyces sp. WM6349]|nr:hypothetical protein ADK49_12885 [Streptomyces sp. WM6349]